MMSPLQKFLFDRKTDLLQKERMAIGTAKLAMAMQISVIDAMFQFLASQQTEEDMAKLQLTLEKQATPVKDIKPRNENQELTESLIELAARLEKEWQEELKRAKKEGRQPEDIKYTLNNLPEDLKPKSVSTKIYALRTQAKLPANVLPALRSIKTEDGKVVEQLYMKWVKNPPKVKTEAGE